MWHQRHLSIGHYTNQHDKLINLICLASYLIIVATSKENWHFPIHSFEPSYPSIFHEGFLYATDYLTWLLIYGITNISNWPFKVLCSFSSLQSLSARMPLYQNYLIVIAAGYGCMAVHSTVFMLVLPYRFELWRRLNSIHTIPNLYNLWAKI